MTRLGVEVQGKGTSPGGSQVGLEPAKSSSSLSQWYSCYADGRGAGAAEDDPEEM